MFPYYYDYITVIMLAIITICIIQSTNIYSWQLKMTTIIIIIIICVIACGSGMEV